MTRLLTLASLVAWATSLVAAEPPKFELEDGDRVVFLGNTLIEREQKYGYWELMLTMAWPERNVTFRNLGWSGDTVWGESRAGFGTQADGFKKLVDEVNAARPTVIFVGYGNVEAFDGEAGLPKFVEGLNKLLDELETTKARIVMLGPVLQVQSPNRTSESYDRNVESYASAVREAAHSRGLPFIDLVSSQRFWEHSNSGRRPVSVGHDESMTGLDRTAGGYLNLASDIGERLASATQAFVRRDGRFEPEGSEFQELVDLIRKKNELFFHRWRQQHETYLFGFRKHEQGNNAKEVFEFDPLVAAEEKKIAELRTKLAAEMKEARDAK